MIHGNQVVTLGQPATFDSTPTAHAQSYLATVKKLKLYKAANIKDEKLASSTYCKFSSSIMLPAAVVVYPIEASELRWVS